MNEDYTNQKLVGIMNISNSQNTASRLFSNNQKRFFTRDSISGKLAANKFL